MDEAEARLILQAYRPGEPDESDPQFAEALRGVAGNPQLASWFDEEQAFDRAMAAHLESVPAPFGLKTRILAQAAGPERSGRKGWVFGFAAVVALLFLLTQVVSLWRPSNSTAGSPPEYAREMVSIVHLAPPLEMESGDLGAIKNWLAKKDAAPMQVPSRLAALEPLGCRILSFRGHDVTLICFRRKGNELAHLFAVDRAAFPKMKPGDAPVYADEGEWMTASWAEKDRVYMIAVQGGRAAVQRYLPDA